MTMGMGLLSWKGRNGMINNSLLLQRIEFGFTRTACYCDEDVLNCYFIPGYLIPDDLSRLADHLSVENVFDLARDYLLASPGPIVGLNTGETFRIPTLVPARRKDGGCRFLDHNDRCSIHAVAPFACAFADVHLLGEEVDRRSASGLRAIMLDHRTNGIYSQCWMYLFQRQQLAPDVVQQRMLMQPALTLIKSGLPLAVVKTTKAWSLGRPITQ
jgi:Fe-S-cluster containining protein